MCYGRKKKKTFGIDLVNEKPEKYPLSKRTCIQLVLIVGEGVEEE